MVHSIVEYRDGSMISQMGIPDMRVPISYALTYPERLASRKSFLDLGKLGTLTFSKPDTVRFPAIGYAYRALKSGDSACIALNAANEASVSAFMCGKIRFVDIPGIIGAVMNSEKSLKIETVDEAMDYHQVCIRETERIINKR